MNHSSNRIETRSRPNSTGSRRSENSPTNRFVSAYQNQPAQWSRVVVLAGGKSPERTVSLASGRAVAGALRLRGHTVEILDPAELPVTEYNWREGDIAFIALHGPFGEDGRVQSILEELNIPYTGSGPTASRLALSKSAAKEQFRQHDVPTPAYSLVHRFDSMARLQHEAARVGYPVVVKPDGQGSSIGVHFAQSDAELDDATRRCFEHDSFAIVERAIIGTEWTLAVFDGAPLPLIQIVPRTDFFDYDAKYADERTEYRFEFDRPSDVIAALNITGLKAANAMGTKGAARVDLMLDEDDRPWVLEVNTIPGLTDHSLVPKAAARAGCDFPSLCEWMLQSAVATAARPQT